MGLIEKEPVILLSDLIQLHIYETAVLFDELVEQFCYLYELSGQTRTGI